MKIEPVQQPQPTFGYCHKQKSLYLRHKRYIKYAQNKLLTIKEKIKGVKYDKVV